MHPGNHTGNKTSSDLSGLILIPILLLASVLLALAVVFADWVKRYQENSEREGRELIDKNAAIAERDWLIARQCGIETASEQPNARRRSNLFQWRKECVALLVKMPAFPEGAPITEEPQPSALTVVSIPSSEINPTQNRL